MKKLYAGLEGRDPMTLDDAGDHYTKHVMAMTAEKSHSKADIAAELGYRDMRIAELETGVTNLRGEVQRLRDLNRERGQQLAELREELDNHDDYTLCDCCQSLTLEPVDAGGHMQCVSCTKLADCSRLKALIRAHISKRDWPADLVSVIEESSDE